MKRKLKRKGSVLGRKKRGAIRDVSRSTDSSSAKGKEKGFGNYSRHIRSNIGLKNCHLILESIARRYVRTRRWKKVVIASSGVHTNTQTSSVAWGLSSLPEGRKEKKEKEGRPMLQRNPRTPFLHVGLKKSNPLCFSHTLRSPSLAFLPTITSHRIMKIMYRYRNKGMIAGYVDESQLAYTRNGNFPSPSFSNEI